MSYQVELRRAVLGQLGKLSRHDREAVLAAFSIMEKDPRPAGVRKLIGIDLWRVRVGDFRLIFSIDDTSSKIIVRKLARRNEATYKGL